MHKMNKAFGWQGKDGYLTYGYGPKEDRQGGIIYPGDPLPTKLIMFSVLLNDPTFVMLHLVIGGETVYADKHDEPKEVWDE